MFFGLWWIENLHHSAWLQRKTYLILRITNCGVMTCDSQCVFTAGLLWLLPSPLPLEAALYSTPLHWRSWPLMFSCTQWAVPHLRVFFFFFLTWRLYNFSKPNRSQVAGPILKTAFRVKILMLPLYHHPVMFLQKLDIVSLGISTLSHKVGKNSLDYAA